MTARFANAAYGPLNLRRLLRAHLDPGEHLVGFAPGELAPSPTRVLAQVGLALIPGIGQVAAVAHGMLQPSRHRVVVLTSRRLFLLRPDRAGPDPLARGITAELPLSLLAVSFTPPTTTSSPAPARGRLRRAGRRRDLLAATAAAVPAFTLTDLRTGTQLNLVLRRATTGATARLREALVILADPAEPPALPDTPAPTRTTEPSPAREPRGGILISQGRAHPLPRQGNGKLGRTDRGIQEGRSDEDTHGGARRGGNDHGGKSAGGRTLGRGAHHGQTLP